MSLINDALKRASNQKASTPPPPGGPPLQPAESSAPPTGPLPVILCIVGIGALLMAGGFWLKSRGTATPPVEQLARNDTVPAPALVPSRNLSLPTVATTNALSGPVTAAAGAAMASKSDSTAASLASAQSASLAGTTNTPSAPVEPIRFQPTPVPLNAAAPAEALAKPAPTLRLQAIYYRMKGPTVVINGKTLKIGDSIEGAKLVAIERNSAEIEYQGARQKLTMR